MSNGKNEVFQERLKRGMESLEEAKALLDHGAEANFVMNSLYYAFFYPLLGLLQTRGMTAPMQSTAIALFEREFVQKGLVEQRFLEAIRTAFNLRPSCDGEGREKITSEDIEGLMPIADEFLRSVERIIP
jgi:uncharacterized protein (UPF0332 family)